MGVYGIQSFLTKDEAGRKATFSGNLKDLVMKKTSNQEPYLVIDSCNLQHRIYKNCDAVCGGDFLVYKEKYKMFITKLLANNIIPLFVEDGAMNLHLPVKRRRNEERIRKNILPLFESLTDGRDRNLEWCAPVSTAAMLR